MRATEAKIAVYGAGAMGTVLGSFLTLGGLTNVHLITRNRAHVLAMRERGACVRCAANHCERHASVTALFPEEMESYDVIFLMTKQRHNEEIVKTLQAHLNRGGIVCTTQNGLPEEEISKIIGKERTYGAATVFGANFIGEGVVEMTSDLQAMRVEVGGYQNDGEKLPLLCEILSFAGNTGFVEPTDNLAGARWTKLAINAAFSGLSVVTGMTFGKIAKRRKTRKIALSILRECIDVAKANGVTLATAQGRSLEKLLGGKSRFKGFVLYMVLPFAMRKHKKLTSGMLKDVRAGKKCEIDFVNGVVVKMGQAAGIEAPFCARVVELVHGIENGLYEIDYKNVDFFAL